VLDLGCGDGKLLRRLIRSREIERVVGLEVSLDALGAARRRLRLDEATPKLLERVTLLHGGLTYRDARLEGFDAAALVEVIEHLEPSRLSALEQVVWHHARPRAVVLTTPNREYNARFPGLSGERLRHRDHRFEWTRRELEDWAGGVAARRGYRVRFAGVGDADPELGPPTQMAVFERCD
jgi:3' terminal RNA ribose 2'-O-methyltransferase Hen1